MKKKKIKADQEHAFYNCLLISEGNKHTQKVNYPTNPVFFTVITRGILPFPLDRAQKVGL